MTIKTSTHEFDYQYKTKREISAYLMELSSGLLQLKGEIIFLKAEVLKDSGVIHVKIIERVA